MQNEKAILNSTSDTSHKRKTMQRLLLFTFFLSIPFLLLSQTDEEKINQFVQDGIFHHDNKEYEKAIAEYNKALELDSKSTLVHYELALTYSEIPDYKKAVSHANKVLKQKNQHMVEAYMVKGNVLDEQGKTKKSIKLFNKALIETQGHYLLNFNLGINYFKLGQINEASNQFISAIKQNQLHGSSHLYLALAQKRKKEVVQSLLPNYYFLLLEPKSERAANAYKLLTETLSGDVSADAVDANQINIVIDGSDDNPYAATEMMIGLLSASMRTKENIDIPKEVSFISNSQAILGSLGGLEIPRQDIWTEFYIPFFNKLSSSNHFETFCNYILQGVNASAEKWCLEHQDEVESFFDWLNDSK
jgi:tetratricopeptide (TPR) repeat protein